MVDVEDAHRGCSSPRHRVASLYGCSQDNMMQRGEEQWRKHTRFVASRGTDSTVTMDVYSKVYIPETQYYYRLIQETCFLPKDFKKFQCYPVSMFII